MADSSLYIQQFSDRFYLKPILTVRNLDLKIQDRDGNSGHITYGPTTNTYLGLGLYMFKLSVELSLRLPVDDKDVERYGKTNAFDFQSNIYSKRWGADIAYQDYEGFYVKNPESLFPTWDKDGPFPQRSDLEAVNFQLNGFYIFNHNKFSYRSSFIQADKQLKSAGSFLLGATLGIFKFEADSALVPGDSDVLQEEQIKAGRFAILGLLPGYTYNFVIKDFYLNLSFSAGPANVWTKYKTDTDVATDSKVRPIVGVRAAFGYNSQRFFCGFSMVSQSISYDVDKLDINGQTGNAKLFFGYRFMEKGFLKERFF